MTIQRSGTVGLPDLESLRCFDAAARVLNFRAAARLVGLTPAAFGQRIRHLEDRLSARLFDRTTRRVQMTLAGERLLPVARRTLADAAQCVDAARGEAGAIQLELVLGTRFELGMSWVVPSLPVLERANPHARLHLYFGSGPDLLERTLNRDIDCAITSARIPDSRIETETLHEERYVFVGETGLLERTPFRRHEHARHHTLIDISAELPLFRYMREAPGFRGGMRFSAHRWVGLGAAIKALILRGDGVGVLPEYMVRREIESGALRLVLPSVRLLSDHFRLVFRVDDPRRSAYSELADSLRGCPIA